MRSKPGKGKEISIFSLTRDALDGLIQPYLAWAIMSSAGEDYAEHAMEITVKVQKKVKVGEMKQALLELIHCLEDQPSDDLVFSGQPKSLEGQEGTEPSMFRLYSPKEPLVCDNPVEDDIPY